ncbi:unnamed protein product [Protopolystoma xenopodis]|uniref:Uncharacterized protein n=1 Tax=Protopolystoma xenopodis TaxID=117903 RepID=A0A3S5B6E2_9PLAT|nr:unnamed protein product [Protopolystoma xenopodis]
MKPSSDDVHFLMDESSSRFRPKRGRKSRGLRQHEDRIKANRLQYKIHPSSSVGTCGPRSWQDPRVEGKRSGARVGKTEGDKMRQLEKNEGIMSMENEENTTKHSTAVPVEPLHSYIQTALLRRGLGGIGNRVQESPSTVDPILAGGGEGLMV